MTSTNAEFNGQSNDIRLKIQIEAKIAEEKKQKHNYFEEKICFYYRKFHNFTRKNSLNRNWNDTDKCRIDWWIQRYLFWRFKSKQNWHLEEKIFEKWQKNWPFEKKKFTEFKSQREIQNSTIFVGRFKLKKKDKVESSSGYLHSHLTSSHSHPHSLSPGNKSFPFFFEIMKDNIFCRNFSLWQTWFWIIEENRKCL